MIGIVNYGSGNIQAISNVFKRSNIPYQIISNPSEINNVDKLILPGVGAFDSTMKVLNSSGLREALDEAVLVNKIPVLGICVGMQILSEGSEEGQLEGLGWIKGLVKKFDVTRIPENPFIPHMGWNNIKPFNDHYLFNEVELDLGFYFVHSYFFEPFCSNNVLCQSYYGFEFASAVFDKHILGVQFHPEKSHVNGIKLLSNFSKY
jgi:glutamine amidotransferase